MRITSQTHCLKLHLDLEKRWRHRLTPWFMACSLAVLPFSANSEEVIDLSSLQLNGNTSTLNTLEGVGLRLTSAKPDQAGSVFTKHKVNIGEGFNTFFTFQITTPEGQAGGDGLMFVVQAVSSDYVGKKGEGIGYFDPSFKQFEKSIGIEFDTFQSEGYGGVDANDNHVSVNTHGHLLRYPTTASVTPSFKNGDVWYTWIDYNGSELEVRVNQKNERPSKVLLIRTLALQEILGGTDAFIGFTSGTGGSFSNHDILLWTWGELQSVILLSKEEVPAKEEAPAKSESTEETPAEETPPVKVESAEETQTEEALPAKAESTEETQAVETPAKAESTEETPAEETPVKAASAEETPTEVAPTESVEETQAEETPKAERAEETPKAESVEEAQDKEVLNKSVEQPK